MQQLNVVLRGASLLAGCLCLFLACINTHGVEEGWFAGTIVLGSLSVVLAASSFVMAWRGRGEGEASDATALGCGLPVVLVGAGLAVLGMLFTNGLRRTEQAESRNLLAMNRAKWLANAMLNYAGDKGSLPPAAVYSNDGRPLLSWRVLILPYLEDPSGRALFEEFQLDEPWDSPHNLRLLEKMPKDYAPADAGPTPRPHSTHFQVFVGRGAAFEGPRGVKLADFPDGGAGTLLLVEAAEAVPWTKPDDLPYAPDEPLPKLGRASRSRFLAAFVDGSVERLSTDLPEEQLRALITRNAEKKPDRKGGK
jgi:hypothetical protein